MPERLVRIALVCASVLSFASLAKADTWSLPEARKYFSPNKRYCLQVVPKPLESQLKYFEDKVKGQRNAGATRQGLNQTARATLYKANRRGSYIRIRTFPLINEVSPLNAVIANSGDYFVTFDNWHSAGYGSDVVVIYRNDGSVVRQLSLEEILTENDIETIPTTISSRWWGRDHYIDEKETALVLRIVSGNESDWTGSALEGAKFYEIRLDLSTGSLIGAKRDILPRWEAQVSSSAADAATLGDQVATTATDQQCAEPDSVDLPRIDSNSFVKMPVSAPLPPYPPLARAARVEGTVVIEMVVAKTGTVSCARYLSGHPLLRTSALAAARRWTFPASGTRMIGTVSLHFRYVKVVPGR